MSAQEGRLPRNVPARKWRIARPRTALEHRVWRDAVAVIVASQRTARELQLRHGAHAALVEALNAPVGSPVDVSDMTWDGRVGKLDAIYERLTSRAAA